MRVLWILLLLAMVFNSTAKKSTQLSTSTNNTRKTSKSINKKHHSASKRKGSKLALGNMNIIVYMKESLFREVFAFGLIGNSLIWLVGCTCFTPYFLMIFKIWVLSEVYGLSVFVGHAVLVVFGVTPYLSESAFPFAIRFYETYFWYIFIYIHHHQLNNSTQSPVFPNSM